MTHPLERALARRQAGIILCYHGVERGKRVADWRYSVTSAQFRDHLRVISDMGLEPCRADAVPLSGRSPRCGICFDDAFQNSYVAAEILHARGLAASWFAVPGALIGWPCWRDAGRPDMPTLLAVELRQLLEGGMEVGSHSLTHRHLTELTQEEAIEEIVLSRQRLQNELGAEVTGFAYPYGDCDRPLSQLVADAGYARAYSTKAAPAWAAPDRLLIPRLVIHAEDDARRFGWKLALAVKRLNGLAAMRGAARALLPARGEG